MIEDRALEKLKDRLRDMGLIVNAGATQPKVKGVGREPQGKPKTSKKKTGHK